MAYSNSHGTYMARTRLVVAFPDTTQVPLNLQKGEYFGQLFNASKYTVAWSLTEAQFKYPSIKMAAINHSLLSQERRLFQRIVYCSIYHASKAYFPCSISSKGQACHHLSMLWCNTLKLQNSHRTKSGMKSRRHIQLELVEAFLQYCQFLLGEMVSEPAWGYLGLLEELMMKTGKQDKGGLTVIMEPRKKHRTPIWVEWLHRFFNLMI